MKTNSNFPSAGKPWAQHFGGTDVIRIVRKQGYSRVTKVLVNSIAGRTQETLVTGWRNPLYADSSAGDDICHSMSMTISTGVRSLSQRSCDWEGMRLSGSATIGYA